MENRTVTVEANNISKNFGRIRAVRGVSFATKRREVFGLLGPNGAGKTTIIRILSTLLVPDSGTARVQGYDICRQPILVRRSIGLLAETSQLYSRLTAKEYLSYFGSLYMMAEGLKKKRIKMVLDLLGLGGKDNDRLSSFSKGMRQKINISRTILHDPPILFLDEPTANLDVESAITVRNFLETLKKGFHKTILLCTHNLSEVEMLCDKIAFIKEGKIIREDTIENLKKRHNGLTRFKLKVKVDQAKGAMQMLASIGGVENTRPDEDLIVFETQNPAKTNPKIIKYLASRNIDILNLTEDEETLENIYVNIMQGQE